MTRIRDPHHATYLPSGVRVVGAGAERFVEQVAHATAERFAPGDPLNTAYATPARLREQYRFVRDNGDLVEAEEHIVLGNTDDPRRCLRIYFSSRVPNEPRFVVGHVGRHFQVQSST